jgi:hypothetical protein
VVVRDTRSEMIDRTGGRGLNFDVGVRVDLSRASISRNRDVGVFVADGSNVSMRDLLIRDTQSEAIDDTGGRGLNVQQDASVEASRTLIAGNAEVGVFVGGEDTTVSMSDAVIRDTRSIVNGGHAGKGLTSTFGATTSLSRVVVDGNRELGLEATRGATLTLEDVVVSGTLPRECVESTCPEHGSGHGVGAYRPGTTLRMSRFAVRDSAICGVHIAMSSAADLVDGEVSRNLIGICLEVPDYDTARLTTAVRYADNDVNLQSTNLPIPEDLDTLAPDTTP